MIIVKKPFNFSIEEENKEEREEEKKEYKEHIEREEKPIVDAIEKVSEDYHGGDESTQSLVNTPSPSQQESNQENNNNDNQGANEGGSGKGEVMSSNNENENEAEGSAEGNQQSENSSENNEDNSEKSSSDMSEQQSQSNQSNNNSNNNEGNQGNNSEGSSGSSSENESSSSEENKGAEGSAEGEEGEHSNSNSNNNNGEDQGNNSEDNNENSSEFSESEQQINTGQYNTQQVVYLDNVNVIDQSFDIKYYQTMFYSFIERFAEEKTKVYDYSDFDTYNIKKLMFRFVEKKPLSAYRATREKDKVVLILDNSGSMDWWADNLYILAKIALERNDIEIYIAPNGTIESRLTKSGAIDVEHDSIMKMLVGRRVIYVGDFDGANTAVELSFRNDVVWICPETRYRKFSAHDWVSYSEEDFKGVFIRAWDLSEMFEGLKRVTRFYRQIIDFHENNDYEDDYDDYNDYEDDYYEEEDYEEEGEEE